MQRHEFIEAIHAAYRPRNYLEIGVDEGLGLARSRTRSIGVDPAYAISAELACDLQLARSTSDDFFAREAPIAWFPEGVIDLAFLDGLHIFEFVLRDFMNVEALSSSRSVILIDDMLPRSAAEATRERHTVDWTGDVFRLAAALEKYRPDLVLAQVDTEPTGLLLVLGADRTNTVLRDKYSEILTEFVHDDPQPVPDEVLLRTQAADPARVLASPVWAALADGRADETGRCELIDEIRGLRGTAQYVSDPPDPGVFPPPPDPLIQRATREIARRVRARASR